ncbi:DNA gyrase subunit A, partial [bacterium]|nr:DNA gyrase subunit A [bacterium]
DFVDNYDGSESEPVTLPAAFPNLLVNGANGIAVGMATLMPTHNLVEVCNAIKAYIVNHDIEVDGLMTHIKGPDFPTNAQIIGTNGIREYFATGQGKFTIRSKYEIEEINNGKNNLIITEIPYSVNKKRLIEQIVTLVKRDELKDITDLRDESSRDGIRIVIELKKDVIPEIMFNKLCRSTSLQVNFSVNNLALVKGVPRILNLKDMIMLYLTHQHDVIIRKSTFDLNKAEERAHILKGLIKAISNIDLAIKIIRNSLDVEEASVKLIEAFEIDEVQAKAILEMKLRALSNLEHQKLVDELDRLSKLIDELKEIISSEDKRNQIIIEKLDYFVEIYGDERKTEILEGASDIDDEDLIPNENIVITMSNNG